MAIERVIIVVIIASSLISMASAIAGTATFYVAPYVPSKCYEYQDKGTMIAAANPGLYTNGAICGKRYRVRCTGGTNQAPNPCRNGEIIVTMVDRCAGCGADQIDLSQEAFNLIGNPDAGKIRIDYTPA